MRTYFRSFTAAAAVTAAVVTGGVATSAPAAAAPPAKPIQSFAFLGDNLGTFGDHDFCRGSLNIRLSSPKRAVTRVTLTSSGFTGNGAGWRKNPRCRVLIGLTNTNGLFTLSETFVPASFGVRSGEKLTRDIVTGSGFRALSVTSYAVNSPVRIPQAYGTALYYVAP